MSKKDENRCTKWGCKNPYTRYRPVPGRGQSYIEGQSYPWYPFCDEHDADSLGKKQR